MTAAPDAGGDPPRSSEPPPSDPPPSEPPPTGPATTGPPRKDRLTSGPLRFPAELADRITELTVLGQGQDSKVYKGWNGRRWVVVKVMHPPEAPDAYEQICALWRRADPRHVVALIDRGQSTDPETVYEITEFVPDGSLHDYLSGRPAMSDEARRHILRQAAEILNHIHNGLGETLLHRDVKPANFLVDLLAEKNTAPGPRIRLADFGSAMRHPVAKDTAELSFTRPYAAPEVFRQSSSPASDWWSLGVMMQEILLGEHPFDDAKRDDPELQRRMNLPTPPAGDRIPSAWRDPIHGLWQRDIEYRWHYQDVDRWLRGENPYVHVQTGPDEAAGEVFRFAGRTIRKLSELATAMGDHWQEAASLVIGYRWQELLAWCRKVSESAAANLARIVDGAKFPGLDAERPRVDLLVTEVIVGLHPYGEPMFRRRPVNPERLAEMARAAQRNDPEAVSFVESLYRSRSLPALSRHVSGAELGRIHGDWQSWHQIGQLLAARTLGSVEQLPEEGRFLAMLLEAAADPQARPPLAERAEACLTRKTRRVGWYRSLFDDADEENAPAYHAFMIVAERLVLRPEIRISPEAREYAAEQYRLSLENPPKPGRTRPHSRPPSRRFGAVALADRPAPRWRRLAGRFGTIAPLLAYLGFAAAAGAGIAEGTTVLEGALVAAVLAVAGVLFTIALSAPVSRLSNGVLGAGLGCIGGLLLGAGGAVAVDGLGGPAAAWPTFWTTWVATTAVTGIAGAAE